MFCILFKRLCGVKKLKPNFFSTSIESVLFMFFKVVNTNKINRLPLIHLNSYGFANRWLGTSSSGENLCQLEI